MDYITQLTKLAYQFGPFLFAVLFCLGLTRYGYKIYKEANLRKNPPASNKEKNTYRLYFITTAFFGIVLVVASIVWWFTHQPMYVFKGTIEDLNSYENVTSDSFYFKTEWVVVDKNAPKICNKHFIYIQDRPFTENQEFKIYYSKNEGPAESLSMIHVSDSMPKYQIEWDTNTGTNIIKSLNPPSPVSSLFSNIVYAQDEIHLLKPRQTSNVKQVRKGYIINLLQDERTGVGKKIEALNFLNSLSKKSLETYIKSSSNKEPMILTLLDLSRHNDKELAYKAGNLINNRFKTDTYLSQKLLSNNAQDRKEAENILFRMEQKKSLTIINNIASSTNSPWINNLKNQIQSGKKSAVLIPTGSSEGDRYYIQAEWNPTKANVVRCLTNLFYNNQISIQYQTLQKETKIMKSRSKRLVFMNSKEKALLLAKEIEECGGKATFVGF